MTPESVKEAKIVMKVDMNGREATLELWLTREEIVKVLDIFEEKEEKESNH